MTSPKTIKQVQELTGRVASLGRFMTRSAERCFLFFKAIRKEKDFVWTDDCQKSFEKLKTYLSSPPLLLKPLPGEDLFLYLSVTEVTVSTVLVREEDKLQKPIYYISKTVLRPLVTVEQESFSSVHKSRDTKAESIEGSGASPKGPSSGGWEATTSFASEGMAVSPDGDATAGMTKSSKGMSGKRSANISLAFMKPSS
ncbi:hypothetical protein RJ639_036522 [Escallonia herrerae]|uniref:Reverse transcriptase/retrotransposon-derived protein RNase H-like domain-containing protein n=1 Tax=Escallonia herrerae TaxID=1293975 RepID=A0AA88WQ68_9ASTE|nr:hypothetical protein RJ639_036522 [Escallonia herrerae]